MGIPIIFGLFIIFLVVFHIKLRLAEREKDQSFHSFLEDEQAAMFSRKKSLDDLSYITPDLTHLPLTEVHSAFTPGERKTYKLQQNVVSDARQPMIYPKSQSNLDLKRQYGADHLETIIQYEENYQRFIRSLYDWAKALYESDHSSEAKQILKEAISLGSDFSQTYLLLADIYYSNGEIPELQQLKELTKQSKSIMMKKVIRHIDQLLNPSEEEI